MFQHLLHQLKHLFSHARHATHAAKHTQHVAKHASNTIAPIVQAATVVGGVNAAVSLVDRIEKWRRKNAEHKKGNEQSGNESTTGPDTPDDNFVEDFLLSVTDMEALLSEHTKTLQELHNKNSQVNTELVNVKNDFRKGEQRISEIKQELQKHSNKTEEMNLQILELKQENLDFKKQAAAHKKTIQRLNAIIVSAIAVISIMVFYLFYKLFYLL